jgi:hypothetical protein
VKEIHNASFQPVTVFCDVDRFLALSSQPDMTVEETELTELVENSKFTGLPQPVIRNRK